MNKTKEMLDERIQGLLKSLNDHAPGTKEYEAVSTTLAELYKLKNEETKNENDVNRNERKMDRYFKLITDMSSVVLPLCVYVVWMRRGFRFEETGTITSQTFKNLIGKFRLGR